MLLLIAYFSFKIDELLQLNGLNLLPALVLLIPLQLVNQLVLLLTHSLQYFMVWGSLSKLLTSRWNLWLLLRKKDVVINIRWKPWSVQIWIEVFGDGQGFGDVEVYLLARNGVLVGKGVRMVKLLSLRRRTHNLRMDLPLLLRLLIVTIALSRFLILNPIKQSFLSYWTSSWVNAAYLWIGVLGCWLLLFLILVVVTTNMEQSLGASSKVTLHVLVNRSETTYRLVSDFIILHFVFYLQFNLLIFLTTN